KKGDFVQCLSEKMLTYALGRGMEYYDQCTVKDIAGATAKGNYRFSSMVTGIVLSDAFLKRRTLTAEELAVPTTRPAPPTAPKPAGAGVGAVPPPVKPK